VCVYDTLYLVNSRIVEVIQYLLFSFFHEEISASFGISQDEEIDGCGAMEFTSSEQSKLL
jgi:hypothetical protein